MFAAFSLVNLPEDVVARPQTVVTAVGARVLKRVGKVVVSLEIDRDSLRHFLLTAKRRWLDHWIPCTFRR
jgi:hypothetical protein